MTKAHTTDQRATPAPHPQPTSAVVLQRTCSCGQHTGGGACAACRKQHDGTLQRQAASSVPGLAPLVQERRQPGQPLDARTRAALEPRFGHDFSRVPLHAPTHHSGASLHADQLRPAPWLAAADILMDEGDAGEPAVPATPPAATPAAPPVTTPAVPAAACVQPINWTHSGPVDNGPDGIRIRITWGSSTGNLADLSNCTVREVVSYDPIPNPPFLWNPPNPTILTVPATAGAGIDTHSYPPGLKTGITNPRQEGTMTAHQVYQFRCTGPGCSGNWTDFPGQTYSIVRQVYPQYFRLNPWRYRITKTGTGAGNSFSYSREVEVPEP